MSIGTANRNQLKTQAAQTPRRPAEGLLQRKCSCGQHTIAGGECDECGKQRLQPRAMSHAWTGEVPPVVHDALRTPGQRLDAATRSLLEPRFGHDFSQVRIHADAQAGESSRALNAHAFTTASDVVFGQGKYSPDTPAGLRLLTHELSHVVQQETSGLKTGAVMQRQAIGEPGEEELIEGFTKEEIEEYGEADEELGKDTGEAARAAMGEQLSVVLRKPGRVNCIAPNWEQLLRKTPDPTMGKTIQGENVKQKRSIGTLVPKKGLDRPLSYSFSVAENVVGTQASENIVGTLYFDDLVFVEGVGGKDNQWYRVTTDKGLQGWVPKASVTLNPPEPGAHLHRIQASETPLGLVSRHYYKPIGLYSGDKTPEVGDERFYVAALAFANKGRAGMPSTVDFEDTSAWEETALIEGTHIWMPSKAFLNSLKGVVSSGSITGGTEELTKQLKEEAVYTAAFIAGLIYGALESIYDVFAGAIELIKMIWNVLESLFTGEIVKDAQTFWNQLKSIDVSKLGEEFDKNWNNPDRWESGFFRGRVAGYVILELLMLYFSFGIATAIKWTGKFAKIGAFIAKLGKVNDVIKAAQKLKMPNKVTALMKSKLGTKAQKTGAKVLKGVDEAEEVGAKVVKGVEKGKVAVEVYLGSEEHLQKAAASFQKYLSRGGKTYKTLEEYKGMYTRLTRNRMVGRLAEEEFQLIMKGQPKTYWVKVGGKTVKRNVDNFLDNVAREVKSGPLHLTPFIEQQILKDMELLKTVKGLKVSGISSPEETPRPLPL